ncbi:Translation elongation factor G [Thioalkalivibrio nitratireducens DSM 14787]|uniref:Elongation factor G n=1 Tax=Thioalkalivibrio nitratireducens (strain DSM 14787 / UNIQEM 213 / ALEN2) TaxID=1255043 RepID=L0DXT7_THIND|nr:elongation factor G [Thioalkalivibrio nitratireducens]AGA34374.1 Translation elongation factor G [Thioalkalivibrio nitratireducens DSM 14787]
MSAHEPILAQLRNIGIIAHIDAGKTTTTERVLYYTGRTRALGSVDAGTAITDWMDQERARGITIVSAAVSSEWRDHRINLIDTPGHIDFTAEVQRALRVLDGGIVVLDAVQGVEPQSETVWRQADQYRVPRICFVNKMDRIGADFDRAVASLRERLGAEPAVLQLPIGAESSFEGVVDLLSMRAVRWADELGARREYDAIPSALREPAATARAELIERIAENDDALLAAYVDGVEPEPEQLLAALRRATLDLRLFPVLCGSALRNKGVQPLLDAVVDLLPSPLDIGPVHGVDPRTDQKVERQPDAKEPLTALAFKVAADPYSGRLTYVRVYSGCLRTGMTVHNARSARRERVGRLVRMYADQREDIEEIGAGDIAAMLGSKGTRTGDTLCAPEHPVLLETIAFPEPVVWVAVEPRGAADQDALATALHTLAEEDPTFRVRHDEATAQMLVAGMGELHLEVLLERVRSEFHVGVNVGRPRVAHKETIGREVPHVEGRHIHQTGGHGQYGHVILALAPGPHGSGIVFESAISGGAIPKQFLPAIERGVHDAAQAGALAGYPVTDVQVRLLDGSHHDVDSTDLAFRTAARVAFEEGLRQGAPVLLEPIGQLEVLVPEEYLGDVMALLAARRCDVVGLEAGPGGAEAVRGHVPLAEMFGFASALRSASQGRALFTMEPLHYAPVDAELAHRMLGTGGASSPS